MHFGNALQKYGATARLSHVFPVAHSIALKNRRKPLCLSALEKIQKNSATGSGMANRASQSRFQRLAIIIDMV